MKRIVLPILIMFALSSVVSAGPVRKALKKVRAKIQKVRVERQYVIPQRAKAVKKRVEARCEGGTCPVE